MGRWFSGPPPLKVRGKSEDPSAQSLQSILGEGVRAQALEPRPLTSVSPSVKWGQLQWTLPGGSLGRSSELRGAQALGLWVPVARMSPPPSWARSRSLALPHLCPGSASLHPVPAPPAAGARAHLQGLRNSFKGAWFCLPGERAQKPPSQPEAAPFPRLPCWSRLWACPTGSQRAVTSQNPVATMGCRGC